MTVTIKSYRTGRKKNTNSHNRDIGEMFLFLALIFKWSIFLCLQHKKTQFIKRLRNYITFLRIILAKMLFI